MSEQDNSKVTSLLDDHDPVLSSLYRESAQEQPPASLDDKILRAAHAAVTAQEEAPTVHKPRRSWPMLGGLAASVLVAVLAVKLLPHSLQTPAPASKERTADITTEADQPAAKTAAPSAASVSGLVPASPEPEARIQQEAAMNNLAAEREKKAERSFAVGATADRSEASMTDVVTESVEETPSATLLDRDDEFDRIVTLWKAGNTTEAITRFEAFQKQYPDFTPNEADKPVYQSLESALEMQTQ